MQRVALVIDDNRHTADSLTGMLELLGLRAHARYSPRQALLELDEELPDLVLLDINMPGIDGFEVLGFLKRDPRLAAVPVVIISSFVQDDDVTRARREGAFEVLPKPVTIDALEELVHRALGTEP